MTVVLVVLAGLVLVLTGLSAWMIHESILDAAQDAKLDRRRIEHEHRAALMELQRKADRLAAAVESAMAPPKTGAEMEQAFRTSIGRTLLRQRLVERLGTLKGLKTAVKGARKD